MVRVSILYSQLEILVGSCVSVQIKTPAQAHLLLPFLVGFLAKNRADCEPRADQCYLLRAKHEFRRQAQDGEITDSNIICLSY